jgi:pimeloyl-ACP methyl ester carboxylesterase
MNQRVLLHEVKGQGEPIVLVPGGLSGWLSWIPFAERLSTERMVVRVQLRSVELAEAGEPFPEDYGVLTEREALHATVNELGLDSFDLAGWSHGGLVSLAFALEYPERVRTLTLIEPSAFWILRETGRASDALSGAEADDRSLSGRRLPSMTSRTSSSGPAWASPATTSSRCRSGRCGSATVRSSRSSGRSGTTPTRWSGCARRPGARRKRNRHR